MAFIAAEQLRSYRLPAALVAWRPSMVMCDTDKRMGNAWYSLLLLIQEAFVSTDYCWPCIVEAMAGDCVNQFKDRGGGDAGQ